MWLDPETGRLMPDEPENHWERFAIDTVPADSVEWEQFLAETRAEFHRAAVSWKAQMIAESWIDPDKSV